MTPQLLAKLERLQAAGIEMVPFSGITSHFILARDGFVSLVEKRPEGFGKAGSSGIMTECGFACLTWRGGEGYFVAKGFEQKATGEQVDSLRLFSSDLQSALNDLPA